MGKIFFLKLFNIYPGEERPALLFAALGFLWALAISLSLRFSDVMFLAHVGAENLPTVYAISALTMIVLASFLLYAYHHIEVRNVYLGIILTAMTSYSLMLTIAGLGFESSAFWYVLRILGTIFIGTFTTGFWTFVDQYYTLQDAKRLYSVLSSSIFLGIATTGVILQLELFQLKALLLFVLCVLLSVSCLVWYINHLLIPVHDENSLQESASQGDLSFSQIIHMLRNSPFTLLLMLSNFCIFVTMVITEYNYLDSFDQHFQAASGVGEIGLETFLGRCLLGVSISNLLIGLLVYNRLVYRFGLVGVLPITGTILVFNYLGWITSNSLIFAVVGLYVVEGTLYVIDDNNFNLLLNGVPARLKYRIRIVIESFFEPVGMLSSSLLLSGFFKETKVLGLILALIVLGLAILLLINYGKAIYLNLAENAIHFQRSVQDWFLEKSEKNFSYLKNQLIAKLDHGETEEKILALEGLIHLWDLPLLEKILLKISHADLTVKNKFLDLLKSSTYAYDSVVIETLHQWYEQESNETLSEKILFYLATGGFLHPEKGQTCLNSTSLLLRGAAIASLKKSWANLPPAQAAQNLLKAVEKQQELLISDDELEVEMGLTLLAIDGAAYDAEQLIPFLKDRRPRVALKAMETFSQLADQRCFRYMRLLANLLLKNFQTEYRQACLIALSKIAGTAAVEVIVDTGAYLRPTERRAAEKVLIEMGLRIVPILLNLTKNTGFKETSRILAVRVLSHLALPQLRANLVPLVQQEVERAYFYYYHYQTITDKYPSLDLSLLRETLETSYRSVIDFIIHVLGEAGEVKDSELLARSLGSRNPKVRSHVIETLEQFSSTEIFRMIRPLVGEVPLREKLTASQGVKGTDLDLPGLLEKLSYSSSELDMMVASFYMKHIHLPEWRKTILRQLNISQEIFHHFAYELLEE